MSQGEYSQTSPAAGGSLFIGKSPTSIQINKAREQWINFKTVETSYTSGLN